MEIILVRHGDSKINKKIREEKKEILCGALDVELSKEGEEQAKKLSSKSILKDIDKCYSSNLKRAFDTAKLAMPNKKIIVDNRIKERSHGVFEGKYLEDAKKEYKEFFENEENINFRKDFIAKAPKGENYTDVCKRLKSFFDELDFQKETKIVIFSHMHCIKCMIYLLSGIDKKQMDKLVIENCKPIILKGNKIGKCKII